MEEHDIIVIRKMIRDESEAVAHYEEAAHKVMNPTLKKLLTDIKEEEMVHIGELKQALKEIYGVTDNEKEGEGKMEANELINKMKRAQMAMQSIDMLQPTIFPTLNMKIRQLMNK